MQEQSLPPLPDEISSRVWIENIRPRVDCGAFPIKRTVGDTVNVSAFVFADGHDEVKAILCYRAPKGDWQERAMSSQSNDLWQAEFKVERTWRLALHRQGLDRLFHHLAGRAAKKTRCRSVGSK